MIDIFFMFFAVLLVIFVFISAFTRLGAAKKFSDIFLQRQTIFYLMFVIFSSIYVWIITFHELGFIPDILHLYLTRVDSALILLFASLSFYFLLKLKMEYSHEDTNHLENYFNILETITLLYVIAIFVSFIWIGSLQHVQFLTLIPSMNVFLIVLYLILGMKLERDFHEPLLKKYTQFSYTFIILTLLIMTIEAVGFIVPDIQRNIDVARFATIFAFTVSLIWSRFTTLKVIKKIEQKYSFHF